MIPLKTRVSRLDEQPGLISVDTVAHCGRTLKSEYSYDLTGTDVVIGWTVNRTIKNKTFKWIIEVLDEVSRQFPYTIDYIHGDCAEENAKQGDAGLIPGFRNFPRLSILVVVGGVYQSSEHHALVRFRSRPVHSNDNPGSTRRTATSSGEARSAIITTPPMSSIC